MHREYIFENNHCEQAANYHSNDKSSVPLGHRRCNLIKNHKANDSHNDCGSRGQICSIYIELVAEEHESTHYEERSKSRRQRFQEYVRQEVTAYSILVWLQSQNKRWDTYCKCAYQ